MTCQMVYQSLPGTEMRLSVIILGTWAIGGEMWGGADERQTLDAVSVAYDCGITTIDTAPIYGDGLAETIIGKAIKGRRDRFILVTKCGLIRTGKKLSINLEPQSVTAEVEQSLKRLGTDHIDIYLCHWPDPRTPIESTMETMRRLMTQGKIKAIGLSNFDVTLVRRARSVVPIAVLQNQYSLLERTIEHDLLPYARETRCGVITYGALAGGILTGKYQQPPQFPKSDARSFFYKYYLGDVFSDVSKRCDGLKAFPHPPGEIAINWVRRQAGITGVIVGCRNAQQVQKNTQAVSWSMDSGTAEEISKIFQRPAG